MLRKPRAPQAAFTGYESFIYLLTEIEIIIGSGTVKWSAATALAASQRLDRLAASVRQLGKRVDDE
jgi:hypothetical protein